jgi:diguanylate cyclase (GGDEF)-like protein
MRRLGDALEDRVEEICRRTVAEGYGERDEADPAIWSSFQRVSSGGTLAVARWIGGGSAAAAIEAGREAWETFGEAAAHRSGSLQEVAGPCLRWREVMVDAVRESAAQVGVSSAACEAALEKVQRSLEFVLMRICAHFDRQRRRTDEELTRRGEELSFLATHDPLTGLPNRALILDRTQQALARARRQQRPAAALFIDLDNFKDVNDTLGHAVGDELLQATAARLDAVVRDSDALGRLGGDEFVVISEELSMDVGAELIAERLRAALAQPFKLAGGATQVSVTASIGIAVGVEIAAEDLLRNADIAMYQAKWDGRNGFVVFEADMQETIQRRMELEMDLREALDKGQFFLAYQPTIDLRDMRPTGMEALVRWRHPSRGELQPDSFIPLLEETGLIMEVGRWVLGEACAQGARWRAAGYPIQMAVNVSARQLDREEIVTDIGDALAESGLDPKALTIEITETALTRNAKEAARRLEIIKGLGVGIAIDDFGTGYSSLAQLQHFPVDALKIDRSFISGLRVKKEGETIVNTLIQLGKALAIETFAEGIEEQGELSLLRDGDCTTGQGFLFSRPLAPEAAESFLEEWDTGVAANRSPAR